MTYIHIHILGVEYMHTFSRFVKSGLTKTTTVIDFARHVSELYSVIFLDVAIVDGVDVLFDRSERQKGIL